MATILSGLSEVKYVYIAELTVDRRREAPGTALGQGQNYYRELLDPFPGSYGNSRCSPQPRAQLTGPGVKTMSSTQLFKDRNFLAVIGDEVISILQQC